MSAVGPRDAPPSCRAGEVNAALQLLESGGFSGRVERDDLAVEDQRQVGAPLRPRLQRPHDLRKLPGLLVAETRPQTDHARSLDLDDRSDAVVLRLVNQLRIDERYVGQRRQHGLQMSGRTSHASDYQFFFSSRSAYSQSSKAPPSSPPRSRYRR